MNNPIIIIGNASKELAIDIFENTFTESCDKGINCKIRLSKGTDSRQFIVSFPNGFKKLEDFIDILDNAFMEADILNDEGEKIEVCALVDGKMFDGKVQPLGMVNIISTKDFDHYFVDAEGNSYVEDIDAECDVEDEMMDRGREIDAYCIKEDGQKRQYISYPEYIDFGGMVGVPDYHIKGRLLKSERKEMGLDSGLLDELKPILFGLSEVMAIIFFFILAVDLDQFFIILGVFAILFLGINTSLAAYQLEYSEDSFLERFKKFSIHTAGIISIVGCLLLGYDHFGPNEYRQYFVEVLPQTNEQKESNEISIKLKDGSERTLIDPDAVSRLKGNDACVITYQKGALGWESYRSIEMILRKHKK